jgi:hypothetical protein
MFRPGGQEPTSHRHVCEMAFWGVLIMAVMLVTLIVLLFAALPTWPYSASGRARYRRSQTS